MVVFDLPKQYPKGVNVYNALEEMAKEDQEGATALRCLKQAMKETGVREDAYSLVGDIVMRMSQLAAVAGGFSVDTEEIPGFDKLADIYELYQKLAEAALENMKEES